jgi:Putative beta-barrel porin-2, OmpL-like. bbp2
MKINKTAGVFFGLIAMGFGVIGVPAVMAQTQMVASNATEAAPPPAAAAAAPSLDERIGALEQELAELKTELSERKAEEAAAAATPAQPAPAAQQAAAPAKTTIASLLGPTSVSGFVDTYYTVNFNHPASQTTDFRSFEYNSHQFALNMVELVLDKAPDSSSAAARTGYHVALGYGQAMTAIDGAEAFSSGSNSLINSQSPGFDSHLKEAYFSYLAPVGKGLQFDVGKFVTPMGAEVIESKDNWNYSRGILFSYAIPFFHFGVRAHYAFNGKVSATGFLLNGWNNVIDNNSGKTYGLSVALNPSSKVSIATTYLAGPEEPTGTFGSDANGNLINVNNDWRQTWDVVAAVNPTSKLSFLFNFDYGRGDRVVTDSEAIPPTLSNPVYWTGLASYLKYAFNDNNYVAFRHEYYYDHDGFTTGTPMHTHFNTFTATYQHTLASYLLTRFEYRRDMASQPVFQMSNFSSPVAYQDTATVGLILVFDSRNAK